MFGREEPYTESMIGHAAQMREAEELLRLKLQGLPTGEEIDTAAFIERTGPDTSWPNLWPLPPRVNR